MLFLLWDMMPSNFLRSYEYWYHYTRISVPWQQQEGIGPSHQYTEFTQCWCVGSQRAARQFTLKSNYSWSPNSCHSSAHSHPAGHLSTPVFDYLLFVLLVNHLAALSYVCVSLLQNCVTFVWWVWPTSSTSSSSLGWSTPSRSWCTRGSTTPGQRLYPEMLFGPALYCYFAQMAFWIATGSHRVWSWKYVWYVLSFLSCLLAKIVCILRHNSFHISQPS